MGTTIVKWVSAEGNTWHTRTMSGVDTWCFLRDVEGSGGQIVSTEVEE